MALSAIDPSREVALPPIESLPDECLLNIFYEVIKQEWTSIGASALVCRRWQQMVDRREIGQLVFDLVGLYLPKNIKTSWQHHHKLSMGYFLNPESAPVITEVPYSSEINVKKGGIAWIAERGFVNFFNQTFLVCDFATPMQVQRRGTESPITAFLAHADYLIAGQANGSITLFSVEGVIPQQSYTAPNNGIVELFPFRQGWISVSSDQVVQHDPSKKERRVVWKFDSPVNEKNRFSLINHLLFQNSLHMVQEPGTPFFSIEVIDEALDLYFPERGWARVQSPTVKFSGCVYLRGKALFTITDHRLGLEDEDFDLGLEEENSDLVALHNLRDEEAPSFEHSEPAYIARNSDGYVATVMGNRFIYFKQDGRTLVFLDFPLTVEEKPKEPAAKRRRTNDSE